MPETFCCKDVYNFTLCKHLWTWPDKRLLVGYSRYCALVGGVGVEGRQIFASNYANKCLRNRDIGNQTVEKVKHCLRSFSSRFNIHFIFAEYVPV